MLTEKKIKNLKLQAVNLRLKLIEALKPKVSHHIGCSLAIIDILNFLYECILKVNPKKPRDPRRDILILSKGHAALALYVVLCQEGFFSKTLLEKYDHDGGVLSEHVSTTVPGVELSTGSLGHGLPVGAGFALSYLNDKKNNKVYVLMSDGELNEGSNWEAFMFAGHHQLHNLIAIIDANGYQGYSKTKEVLDLSPLDKKLDSFNWNVYKVDGHSYENLIDVFQKIQGNIKNGKPHVIIAKTVKGKGVSHFEDKFESHYKSIDADLKEKILIELHKLL